LVRVRRCVRRSTQPRRFNDVALTKVDCGHWTPAASVGWPDERLGARGVGDQREPRRHAVRSSQRSIDTSLARGAPRRHLNVVSESGYWSTTRQMVGVVWSCNIVVVFGIEYVSRHKQGRCLITVSSAETRAGCMHSLYRLVRVVDDVPSKRPRCCCSHFRLQDSHQPSLHVRLRVPFIPARGHSVQGQEVDPHC
jgi:hypothetical protein